MMSMTDQPGDMRQQHVIEQQNTIWSLNYQNFGRYETMWTAATGQGVRGACGAVRKREGGRRNGLTRWMMTWSVRRNRQASRGAARLSRESEQIMEQAAENSVGRGGMRETSTMVPVLHTIQRLWFLVISS